MPRILALIILGPMIFASLFGYLCIHSAHCTYSFSIPFMITMIASFFPGVIAMVWNTRIACLIQNVLAILSTVFFVLTMAHWSGGDDGTGMLMIVIVAPLVLLAAILALFSTGFILTRDYSKPYLMRKPLVFDPTDGNVNSNSAQPTIYCRKPLTSDLPIVSLTASCLSLLVGPVGCLVGIVCGHLARREIKKHPKLGGAGIALAGLIVGYIFLAIFLLMLAWIICNYMGHT